VDVLSINVIDDAVLLLESAPVAEDAVTVGVVPELDQPLLRFTSEYGRRLDAEADKIAWAGPMAVDPS